MRLSQLAYRISRNQSFRLFCAAALVALTFQSCKAPTRPDDGTDATSSSSSTSSSVVRFYSDIPKDCSTVKGLRQSVVKKVTSNQELIKHYGISFRIRFQDGVTPDLYGALYYQDPVANKYCMALPNGRFAVFQDSQVTPLKQNIAQEICYPMQNCL